MSRHDVSNYSILFYVWVLFINGIFQHTLSLHNEVFAFQIVHLSIKASATNLSLHHSRDSFDRNGSRQSQSIEIDSSVDHDILSTLDGQGLSDKNKQQIIDNLHKVGLWDGKSSSEDLILLAKDFMDRPEIFSTLLITDFNFPPLVAHQTRALAMSLLRSKQERQEGSDTESIKSTTNGASNQNLSVILEDLDSLKTGSIVLANGDANGKLNSADATTNHSDITSNAKANEAVKEGIKKFSDKEFLSTIVNERAKKRKTSVDKYSYGLPSDYAKKYPKLAMELDAFYTFMIQPSTYSQEDPIRPATAKIYLTHAKLFLGWCVNNVKQNTSDDVSSSLLADEYSRSLSIYDLIPNKEKEYANRIIDFVLWLRSRYVSVSYEANLLRGIIKLLKYRFAKESQSDPLDGRTTFDDIPIIKEVRKLHRDANKRQRLAPRSSDEQKKWISWPDYLFVVQNTKNEVLNLIKSYRELPVSERKYEKGDIEKRYSKEQKRIAEAYNRYLILAIFSSIPDRQRTIRELEIGRTLVKDPDSGFWIVKHGPDDYKTGKHYGERPAMQLAEELTPAIDDFIVNWRPALDPSTNFLLVQSRTGKPMTGDSIFQRVVRCCFKYTGKRANPHLLRDIIVTHVRETNASEKELEALALFMGHSIQMQRSSYDRRTLSNKIAPAIKLMQSVNKGVNENMPNN